MNLSYRTESYAKAIATIYNKPLDKPEWFKVVAAKDNEEAQILIFDYVGYPYNDPRDLIHALADMGDVTVRINSPGGDCFDGASIYNSLTSHKGVVTTRIEGLAASIASVIAMAGKRVQAYDNTLLMVHNSWTFMMGNQYEMRDIADLLEKIDGTILDAYQKKTKMGKKEISEMMKATTWLTAKEAKDKGFVDTIVDGKSVKADFNLSIFANLPENINDDSQGRELTRKETERALRNAGASREYARALAAKRADASEDDNQAEKDDHDAKELVQYLTIASELKKLTSILTA